MLDTTTRTTSWLADLALINADIARNGLPSPSPRKGRRARKVQPWWED